MAFPTWPIIYGPYSMGLKFIHHLIVKPVNFLILVAICFRFSCISRLESRFRLIRGAPFSSESLFAACTVVIDTLLRALLLFKVQIHMI